MSYGLKVWDEAGQLQLDTSDRLGRFQGSITLGSIPKRTSVNYSVPGYTLDGTWFCYLSNARSYAYISITEQAGNINVFNTDYVSSRGLEASIFIFRG
jgi:hypothetical protein